MIAVTTNKRQRQTTNNREKKSDFYIVFFLFINISPPFPTTTTTTNLFVKKWWWWYFFVKTSYRLSLIKFLTFTEGGEVLCLFIEPINPQSPCLKKFAMGLMSKHHTLTRQKLCHFNNKNYLIKIIIIINTTYLKKFFFVNAWSEMRRVNRREIFSF